MMRLRAANPDLSIADFGTRRRYSRHIHEYVLELMKQKDMIKLTSNVSLAMKYNLKAVGTQAHEWFMFHAAKYGFNMANEMALEKWVDVYQGDLGIALADTFTTDVFLDSFGMKYAKLFDGVRHDSGNPLEFADKIIAHYNRLGINPRSKTIVFSDGLNVDAVEKIENHCVGDIGTSYGIGTNLTNDVGVTPMNMVIKMIACNPDGGNWINTIKLSDTKGKNTGDDQMIALCKNALGLEQEGG
jgi:nicotinate phosphoribosyltransferase